jgi:CheY-like chemotaxis protein
MSTKRLLIIEDDYDVAEMLLMYFQSHDYEVDHADNGPDGIELARRKFPNLILLDVMLPEMNGYEVCADLRSTSLTKHIPVIFLTQKDGRADTVEGLELGADDYIPKPFDVDELRLRAQRSIERATRESLHERRTGLPTGPMVEDEIDSAQRLGDPHHIYYFQIQGFEAFRDVYGFMSADQVMAFAAKTIREELSTYGTDNDFVGILEDTFIVLTYVTEDEKLLDHLTQQFNEKVKAFYTFVDVNRGGVLVDEGTDTEATIPIMRLKRVHIQA